MNWDNYVNLKKTTITLSNVFDLVGKPASELEFVVLGGINELKGSFAGFYTENLVEMSAEENALYGNLRYDFALCEKSPLQPTIRIEANGSQHFWLWNNRQTLEDYKTQQLNFYFKQTHSSIPIVNLNMTILGDSKANVIRYKAYRELVEKGIFKEAVKLAKSENRHVNILLGQSNEIVLPINECGIEHVDTYITQMITNSDFKVLV